MPSHNLSNTFNISSPNLSPKPHSLPLSQAISSLMYYGSTSIAEQTLSAHKFNPNQVINSDKPLVQKDNNFYAQTPEHKYISRYLVNPCGCLGCGDPLYLFRNFPRRNESSVRSVFWQEIQEHIPFTRKRSTEQKRGRVTARSFNTNADSGTTENRSSSGLGRTSFNTNTNSGTTDSSSSSGLGRKECKISCMNDKSIKKCRKKHQYMSNPPDVESWFLLIMARITDIDIATNLPILIQINNHFPCIDFCLGSKDTKELWTRMIFDSRAVMNSGNKSYHQQVIH